jgi:hypothetical protein
MFHVKQGKGRSLMAAEVTTVDIAAALGSLQLCMADVERQDPDLAWEFKQDILWWVLNTGARDDGVNAGYIVTLARSAKDQTSERTLLALSMIQGVVGVIPLQENPEVAMAESRIRSQLLEVALGRRA